MLADFVRIIEVGPRDGLQNEKFLIPTKDKIRLVDLLSEANIPSIEVTSFVSPKWVPQMADAKEVLGGIRRNPTIHYSALVPNLRGFNEALASKIDEVAVFASASEAFSKKNINCSINESLKRFEPIIEASKSFGIPVRGYVSCIVECPYSGKVNPAKVAYVAKTLLEMGCYEISLGDTTGGGTPDAIRKMLIKVLEDISPDKFAGHFHDTGKKALQNIEESLKFGLRSFDSSIGGLGGCPFAPGAEGNVATESVVKYLHQNGYKTGIDFEKLIKAQAHAFFIKDKYSMAAMKDWT